MPSPSIRGFSPSFNHLQKQRYGNSSMAVLECPHAILHPKTHTDTHTDTHIPLAHTQPQAHTHNTGTHTHTTRTNAQTLTIQRCSRGYRKMRVRCLRLRLKGVSGYRRLRPCACKPVLAHFPCWTHFDFRVLPDLVHFSCGGDTLFDLDMQNLRA